MRRYGSFDATCIRYAGSVCKLIGTTCWNISGSSQNKTPGLKSGFTMTFEPRALVASHERVAGASEHETVPCVGQDPIGPPLNL